MAGTGELPNDSRPIRRDIESRLLVEEGLELRIIVEEDAEDLFLKIDAVSYTHLTLPTKA